ncbi:alpha-1 4-glucan-protein synthase [Halosegnis marinus]|uniref:Alpha-1 4-glucan-protein synthase n=1 Tax=Halosegnis marinus TaxID=3034023 RepID=A0ABD5ZSH4_9EURY|nr:alpha-1 4-glucan-protein synthase [Halosegnis sp. DT85]
MTDTCVIVPTIREYECVREYVANAREHGHADRLFFLLVTEEFCDTDDMEAMLDDLGVEGAVFDGSDREDWYETNGMAEYGHVVPAASHAETSFGLLYMWAGDFEFGFFIDDDTLPHDTDYFGGHYDNLARSGEVTEVSSPERWVNVLYENVEEHGLYPRGYPYAAMAADEEETTVTLDGGEVVASQGLWTNVPDLDAVRILMDGDLEGLAQTRTTADDYEDDFLVAEGDYTTVCSMNLAFRRRVVPAFYQLPMDDNEWDVGRFDDIWSGVFLKRAADAAGDKVLTGSPLCEHNKAPRPTFDDLNNEVPALELNEHVWEVADAVEVGASGPEAATYRATFEALAEAFAEGDFDEWTNGDFLNFVGEHMRDWLAALDALDESARATAEVAADD